MLHTKYLILYVSLFVATTKWPSVISDSPTAQMLDSTYNDNDYDDAADFLFSDELTSTEYNDWNAEPHNNGMSWTMGQDATAKRKQSNEFDVIIFTQQWPVTTCYHWRETNKDRKCLLPQKKEFWTIHGLWPTKLGHLGPSFCNSSAEFDLRKLQTIEENLNVYWPDIDADDSYNRLWQHEWLKHGTCASQLPTLSDELKYFGMGLAWRHQYLISGILDESDIHPDSNSTVIALQLALQQGLGKNPSIHCIYDKKRDLSLLAEIRICFDKTLQLIDCDGVQMGDARGVEYPGGTVITNCIISKPVHYPSFVPPLDRWRGNKRQHRGEAKTATTNNKKRFTLPLVNLYKLVQFIMWSTL